MSLTSLGETGAEVEQRLTSLRDDAGGQRWHHWSIVIFRSNEMFRPLIDARPSFGPMDYDEDSVTWRTLVAIAECDVTQRAVFVACELALIRNLEAKPTCESFHEFSFSIVVQSLDGADLPIVTQDRDIARSFIPAELIEQIMPIVLRSCHCFIEEVKPERIYRVTKMSFSTPRALFKHDLITNFLHGAGYSVTETGLDPFGRRFWLMKKE